ncbi:hypothetical protein AQUCO_00500201v1 [Aquilegia coerulea]|uniref:Wound-induced protein 1 n=1 Tax=Aquilegia coerulea TaxID=218851 RepID=A0A2G5EQS1_AQUCA|nr:hypothetical protein AQUCO_00500201v1 [Aquilegia coerulea]
MATLNMEILAMEKQIRNKAIVEVLYKALRRGDTESAASLLASDLEWWFHGPPRCEHMMRVLTGMSIYLEFKFEPRSITAIDERVIVEGWEGDQAYWVHVWSLKDGLITQFREYFNTWLTVRDLRNSESKQSVWEVRQEMNATHTLWQSEPSEHLTRSLPGLVLAI